MNPYIEIAMQIIVAVIGVGGIASYLKARSDVRNANKGADIDALVSTMSALQTSYKELQDRYQEAIKECDEKNDRLEIRIERLEAEYIAQQEEKLNLQKRVQQLEHDLKIANRKITEMQTDLVRKDVQIRELKEENSKLRKVDGCRMGLEKL